MNGALLRQSEPAMPARTLLSAERRTRLFAITTESAAMVHWNTVYLDRAVRQSRVQGAMIPSDLLAQIAPLGPEHIGLTGDYVWTASDRDTPLRPLRDVRAKFPPLAA